MATAAQQCLWHAAAVGLPTAFLLIWCAYIEIVISIQYVPAECTEY